MAALLSIVLLAQVASADPSADSSLKQPDNVSAGEESGLQAALLEPRDPRSWPLGGTLGARLYCIEWYESRHYGGARNPYSGASGWLQWLPATARAWGVIIGDRTSEWLGAARIATYGEAFFRSQWVPLRRGLC